MAETKENQSVRPWESDRRIRQEHASFTARDGFLLGTRVSSGRLGWNTVRIGEILAASGVRVNGTVTVVATTRHVATGDGTDSEPGTRSPDGYVPGAGLEVLDRGLGTRYDVSDVGIDIVVTFCPVLPGFPAFGAPPGLLLLLLLLCAFTLPLGKRGTWLSHFASLAFLEANAKRWQCYTSNSSVTSTPR